MYSQVFIIQIIYIGQNNSCARRKTRSERRAAFYKN